MFFESWNFWEEDLVQIKKANKYRQRSFITYHIVIEVEVSHNEAVYGMVWAYNIYLIENEKINVFH